MSMRNRNMIYLLMLVFTAPFAAAQDSIPVMGNWHGEFTSAAWQERSIRAEVVGLSWNDYRAVFFVGVGDEERRVQIEGRTHEGVTHFEGEVDLGAALGGTFTITGQAKDGVFTGAFSQDDLTAEFRLERVVLTPPNLGKEPPEGAIVLLGTDQETNRRLLNEEWHVQPHWVATGDGDITIAHSNIFTQREFGDARFHIEFRVPYQPHARGQGRGNSGVYVMGRYEVQVLDSFGELPAHDGCGGIYSIKDPDVNASLPPLEWQTYDITIRAPRFDQVGNKTQNAIITIVHNGVTIHDEFELPRVTPGGVSGTEAEKGPIFFQDHSDSLPRYRNVWVLPLD